MKRGALVGIIEGLDSSFVQDHESLVHAAHELLSEQRSDDLAVLTRQVREQFVTAYWSASSSFSAVAFGFQSPRRARSAPIWPWPSRQERTISSINRRYAVRSVINHAGSMRLTPKPLIFESNLSKLTTEPAPMPRAVATR